MIVAWAVYGFQPITVTSVAPSPDGAVTASLLVSHGYTTPLIRSHTGDDAPYWNEARQRLTALRASVLRLVPELVASTGCPAGLVVQPFSAALADPTPATVLRWSRRLAVPRREVEVLLARAGLGKPKRALDLLRLAKATTLLADRMGTREQVARRCAFSSADYLGKRAKRLTGYPLAALTTPTIATILAAGSHVRS